MMGTTHDTDPTAAEDVHTVDERDQTTRVTTDPRLFGLAVPLPDGEPTVIDEPITERSDTSDDPESDVATDPGPPPVREVDESGLGFKRNRLRAPRAARRTVAQTLERSDNGALATSGELYAKASVEARPLPKATQIEPVAVAAVMVEPRVAAITAPMFRAAPALVEGGNLALLEPRPGRRVQETTNPGEVRRNRRARRKLIQWILVAFVTAIAAIAAAALLWPRDSAPTPAPPASQRAIGSPSIATSPVAATDVRPNLAVPAVVTPEAVTAPATAEPPPPGVRSPAAPPISPRNMTPPLNPPTTSTTKPREVPPLRSIDSGPPPPHPTVAPPPAASSGPAPRFNQFFPEER